MEETGKTNLLGLTETQLAEFVEDIGEPGYRGRQIFEWLYQRQATGFAAMTNLGKRFRDQLERSAEIRGVRRLAKTELSLDGTRKFLFELHDGTSVESVLIPPPTAARTEEENEEEDNGDTPARTKQTLCVSTQVGCPLGCAFCATGTMGLMRNLEPGEIVDQVLQAGRATGLTITNVVFMGMGEPFLNYDAVMTAGDILATGIGITLRRITVSTSGLPAFIKRMADEKRKMKLAVSLHSAVDATRSALMPVNKRFTLDALQEALAYYYAATKQRVTYEFIFFEGINDTDHELKALIRFARRVPCKINVIPFHSVSFTNPTGLSATLRPSPRVEELVRELRSHHLTAIVRSSAGVDIHAACGQLAVPLVRRPRQHSPATN